MMMGGKFPAKISFVEEKYTTDLKPTMRSKILFSFLLRCYRQENTESVQTKKDNMTFWCNDFLDGLAAA